MRHLLIGFLMLMCPVIPALAEFSVGIEFPGVNIGLNVPTYPRLVQVPGYPVYYDPRANSNYFFYDGLYWVYQEDNWYSSSWYNGPWQLIGPEYVPEFVLRVPVRYYRRPPQYFHGWQANAAPRWSEHWGHDWEQRRAGWDRRDRRSVPAAPLPNYQRRYSGERYPRASDAQHSIQSGNYHYKPREPVARELFQPRGRTPGAARNGDQRASTPQSNWQSNQQTERVQSRENPPTRRDQNATQQLRENRHSERDQHGDHGGHDDRDQDHR